MNIEIANCTPNITERKKLPPELFDISSLRVSIGLVCVIGTASLMVAFPAGNETLRFVMLALTVLVILRFFMKVRYHLRRSRGVGFQPTGSAAGSR